MRIKISGCHDEGTYTSEVLQLKSGLLSLLHSRWRILYGTRKFSPTRLLLACGTLHSASFLVFEPAMNTKFLRSASIKLLERMRLEPTWDLKVDPRKTIREAWNIGGSPPKICKSMQTLNLTTIVLSDIAALLCGCSVVKLTFYFHQTASWLWIVCNNSPVFTPTRV